MATPHLSDIQIYGRLLGYVKPFWIAFLISMAGYLIYSLSNVAFVQLLSYIVDSIDGNDPLADTSAGEVIGGFFSDGASFNRTLIPFVLVMIAFARGVGSFLGNYFITFVSTNVVHSLRCELFDQLLKLPSSFYDRNSLGHLVSKVTFHVAQVTGAATAAIRVVIREGFTVLGYLTYLLVLNWRLTLIFIAVAPFIVMLVNYAGKRFRRISERIQHSMGDVTHIASEAVQGYRVVRTFGGSAYERKRFQKVSNYNRRQSMKMVVTASVSTPVIQLLVAIALGALVWLVLDPVLLQNMTAGKVIAFITTAGLLAKPIRQLSEVNETIQKGLAAAQDIFALFDEEVEKDSGTKQLADVRGQIEFRNVAFRYSDDSPLVLQDLNFKVEAGQTVALVGRSGSGKSTLASLIPRFYTPTQGEILLDGQPINDLRLENLRSHIAVVTQQITLFNDTVARNIAYGALESADPERIREAAKQAYALHFIDDLADGMYTQVGDDGVLLSGGQRQRLAIARAFLKDSPILILDEATSALDSESEKNIQAALEAVVKGRTTFIIAHRLSTIERADVIFVIDNGRIVEHGSHRELLTRGGHYAQLHRHQFSGDSEPDSVDSKAESNFLPIISARQGRLTWRSEEFNPLLRAWYNNSWWVKLLSPLSLVFQFFANNRRKKTIRHKEKHWRAPVPVVVVGNINVGGTGKSPLVMWLAEQLKEVGIRPGIVSRGYGGKARGKTIDVGPATSPAEVGEEAIMIARRTKCPVVVDVKRTRAVQYLLENHECDLVISDDGLQHYALDRDVEIAVLDSSKGLGNGLCLPAGPLREPPERLKEVDYVIVNGDEDIDLPCAAQRMQLRPQAWINLHDEREIPIDSWSEEKTVHGVAGIANPDRFFDTLRSLGFEVIEHRFEDHQDYSVADLVFGNSLPVIMTEKDAVKARLLSRGLMHENYWYLKVTVDLDDTFIRSLLSKIDERTAHP